MKIFSFHLAIAVISLAFTMPVKSAWNNFQLPIFDTLPPIPDSLEFDTRQSKIDSMLEIANSFIGTPYCYGSTSSKTFDCSGFTAHVFKSIGVDLPHGSASQAMLGDVVKLEDLQPGDLMFFKGRSSKSKRIGHVSLVIEANGDKIKMIHATSRGVIVDVYQEMDYYTRRFIMARRIEF